MKYKTLPIAFILCTAVLSGCGSAGEPATSSAVASADLASYDPNSVAVETSIAKKGSIEEKSMFSGTVQPIKTVDVASPRTGVKVTSVNFEVGDSVKAGYVLFSLDTSDIQNNINVLNASLASADASIQSAQTELEQVEGSQMKQQIENSKTAVSSAQRAYDTAKAQLDTAKRDYDSANTLFINGAVAQTELTNLKNAYDEAVRNEQAAKEALNSAQYSYDLLVNETLAENKKRAQNGLDSAVAQKNAQAAQMQSYKKELADSNVKSPITGTVLSCNAVAGSVLTGDMPFVIVDLSTVKIEINVSEEIVNSLSVGDIAEITVESYSNTPFEGKISTIAPGSNTDGTFPVSIEISNPDGKLKSGMFAEVKFVKDKSSDNIVLDKNAVLIDSLSEYVYIIKDSKAERVDVTTGLDNGTYVEILTGINEGDEVVINGSSYLNNGDSVRVVNGKGGDNENSDKNETLNTQQTSSEPAEKGEE